jgi:hypothetical protein
VHELGLIGMLHEGPADWARVTRCRSSRIIGAPDKRNIATGVQSSTNIYSITAGSCLGKPPAAAIRLAQTGVTCPTPLVILTLFLIGRDGQIVRPVTPTDGCGLPQPQLLAALQLSDLKFQPLPQFPLGSQLRAQQADLGVLRLSHRPQPGQQLTLLLIPAKRIGLTGHKP